MRCFKRSSAYLAFSGLAFLGLSAVLILAAPAFADEAAAAAESKPATYVVNYQCQSGQFARIVTHDQKLSETIEQLSKGAVTPAQVLDYVTNNASREVDKTLIFLDVCVGVKFRRT